MNSVIRWIETEFIHVSLDSRKKNTICQEIYSQTDRHWVHNKNNIILS